MDDYVGDITPMINFKSIAPVRASGQMSEILLSHDGHFWSQQQGHFNQHYSAISMQ